MSRIPLPKSDWKPATLLEWANSLARRFVSGTFDWTPGLIPATDEVTTVLTTSTSAQFGDLRPTMVASVNPPSTIDAGLIVSAPWVPADGQIAIRVYNYTAGGITPASGTWTFEAFQT